MISYVKEMPVKQIGERIWDEEAAVVVEHHVSVMINGLHALRLVCSCDQIEELVIGHLFTQGYIARTDEIEKIYVETAGKTTQVILEGTFGKTENSVMTTTGSVYSECALPTTTSGRLKWKKEWIFRLAVLFLTGTTLYKKTHGLHSCMLAREDQCLYFSEDIGRHNALDKVVGRALLDKKDLSELILYSSGRIPADMMRKVIRSHVSVIVTNSVPTDEAVCLAQQYGITLIGKARPYGMILYTDH